MTHTRKSVVVALVATALTIGLVDAVPAWAAAPTITSFTPTSGKLNTTVTITGTGFTAPATVRFNGVAATTATVSSSTTIVTRVPYTAASGPLTVTTAGGTVTSTASFTVTPGVLLNKTSGPPTTPVNVNFSGFTPFEAVDVYVDTTDVALASTGSTGAATVTVTIPGSTTPGTHYVTVVGRRSGVSAQASFLVRTDWTQYGFGAGRTNANPYEGTLAAGNVATLTRAWSTPTAVLDDYAAQQATVAGGIVYLLTGTVVSAFSESTGAKVWSQPVTGGAIATPTVSGGLVLVGTNTGHIMAFTASTGTLKYDFAFSGESISRPVVVSGSMAFMEVDQSSTSATVIGFDVASGAIDWQDFYSTYCFGLTVAGGTLYSACNDGHLRAVHAADGTAEFDVPGTTYLPESPPVVANGLVYDAGYDRNTSSNAVFAFDSDTGDLAWDANTTLDTNPSTPLVVDRGNVFLASTDDARNSTDVVAAFSAADGNLVWTKDVFTIIYFTPAAANGLLYVPGASTTVLDETTGALVTRVRGTIFDVVTDAGLITATPTANALMRYTLPSAASPTVTRPDPARLHPDRSLPMTRAGAA